MSFWYFINIRAFYNINNNNVNRQLILMTSISIHVDFVNIPSPLTQPLFNQTNWYKSALRVLYFHLTYCCSAICLDRQIEVIVENCTCRIYFNYLFFVSRLFLINKPDIVLLDLDIKSMFVIELGCPTEKITSFKEGEKR